MNPVYEAIGFTSGAIGLSIAAPQLFRVLRARSRDGVSLTTWAITLAMFSLFGAYGIRYESLSQTVTNGIACVLTGVLVFLLAKDTWNTPVAAAVVLAVIAGFFSVTYYSPAWMMTTVIFSMMAVSKIPQILTSRRFYLRGHATVVSKTTFTLIIVSSVGWMTYGALTGLWHNIVASSFNIVASSIILFYETRPRNSVIPGANNRKETTPSVTDGAST